MILTRRSGAPVGWDDLMGCLTVEVEREGRHGPVSAQLRLEPDFVRDLTEALYGLPRDRWPHALQHLSAGRTAPCAACLPGAPTEDDGAEAALRAVLDPLRVRPEADTARLALGLVTRLAEKTAEAEEARRDTERACRAAESGARLIQSECDDLRRVNVELRARIASMKSEGRE